MGQVLHGSATTTEAVRRAIQHSHLWTAPALQGFIWADPTIGRVRSSFRPVDAALMTAGPDGVR
ncbi:MAG: hypothetical protein DI537_30995 [Stutzerimonas stutzeri]|nr:MAG: hypothetical protein DI537_30995 [Stutzerimonas stutzeri]